MLFNVIFIGDTYPLRAFFNGIGCHWDSKGRVWHISEIDEKGLQSKFQNYCSKERLYYTLMRSTPNRYFDRFMIIYLPGKDTACHKTLVNCDCTLEKTCQPCQFACCPLVKVTEELGFSGFHLNCQEHGKKSYGTYD